MTNVTPARTTVAEFIADSLALSDRTQREIAQECGFDTPNVISMIKDGSMKVPISRVGALAKALEVDPAHLLRLVLLEYAPETWEAIENIMQSTVLTANELKLVHAYRHLTGDNDATPVIMDGKNVVALISA